MKEIEIILVDDGSPDNCPKICDAAAAADKRIKVIHKENAGQGFARNKGLEAATGKYVGFVDSDDYVNKNMFEELYCAAEKNDAQLVLSGVCFVGGNMFEKENEYTEISYFKNTTLFTSESDIENLMLGIAGALPHEPNDSRYGVSVWKNLFSRDVIEKNNVKFMSEREILSEDTLFMTDYVKYIKRAVGIPGAYYNYCRNSDSFSKSYNPERLYKSMIFLKELEKRLMSDIPRDKYKIYLDRLTQSYGRVLCSQEVVYASENKIGYSDLKKRLKEICTTKEIANSLKEYPWYKLPIKQAVFAFCIKYRLYFMQKILVLARSK